MITEVQELRRGSGATPAGHGSVVFTRVGPRTVIERALASSPLRLLSPRTFAHAQTTYTTTFGGGLVAGDSLNLDAHVREGASALLTTQSSTKVYRGSAQSVLEARVDDDALLVVCGDPLVCFAGARYAQRVSVQLAERAALVLVDALTAGRVACGERWAFDGYSSRIEIGRGGEPIVLDSLRLDRGDGDIAERMRGFDALATVIVVGRPLARHVAAILAAIGGAPRSGATSIVESTSPLGADGAIVRIATTEIDALAPRIRVLLGFVPALLGDDPWSRRPG